MNIVYRRKIKNRNKKKEEMIDRKQLWKVMKINNWQLKVRT